MIIASMTETEVLVLDTAPAHLGADSTKKMYTLTYYLGNRIPHQDFLQNYMTRKAAAKWLRNQKYPG